MMNSNSGGGHCRQIINVCNADMINDDDDDDYDDDDHYHHWYTTIKWALTMTIFSVFFLLV